MVWPGVVLADRAALTIILFSPYESRLMRRSVRRSLTLVIGLACLTVIGIGVLLYALQERGIAPRMLGPYVERRSSGHNPLIERAGRWTAAALTDQDREAASPQPLPANVIGAQPSPRAADSLAGGSVVLVASADGARAAIARAQPGEAITFLPGSYRFDGGSIRVTQAGSAQAPITVRAAVAGTVVLEFALEEGFSVTAPWWRFENLTIRGACKAHSDCEHAFHVSGGAHHFAAVNNTISDFNAHFKINGADGRFPDSGVIEHNTLNNTSARQTANPVTPIDLVAASGWTVRANLISDFVKADGNRVSFGAFAKGGGSANRFVGNIVICERMLTGQPGQRIGISLGGGSTEAAYCRDRKCITEQSGSAIESNLISACSDDGIYLNSAANSRVVHNSVIDTAGVDVRFATSSAQVAGNLVDGAIRSRDGGLVRADDNLDTATAWLYFGRHPQRALLKASAELDFRWAGAAPRRAAGSAIETDLCGAARPTAPAYGAFEDFAACLTSARR
jgi:parallel beta-helix repeat protein